MAVIMRIVISDEALRSGWSRSRAASAPCGVSPGDFENRIDAGFNPARIISGPRAGVITSRMMRLAIASGMTPSRPVADLNAKLFDRRER